MFPTKTALFLTMLIALAACGAPHVEKAPPSGTTASTMSAPDATATPAVEITPAAAITASAVQRHRLWPACRDGNVPSQPVHSGYRVNVS